MTLETKDAMVRNEHFHFYILLLPDILSFISILTNGHMYTVSNLLCLYNQFCDLPVILM